MYVLALPAVHIATDSRTPILHHSRSAAILSFARRLLLGVHANARLVAPFLFEYFERRSSPQSQLIPARLGLLYLRHALAVSMTVILRLHKRTSTEFRRFQRVSLATDFLHSTYISSAQPIQVANWPLARYRQVLNYERLPRLSQRSKLPLSTL